MEAAFLAFAKFGNRDHDGKTITLTNSDKWMKQAGVIDKKLTTTDTAICFNKFKSKTLDYNTYMSYVEALAKEKKMDPEVLKGKLLKCAIPGTTATTSAVKDEVLDRLTDTSKYTGAHKERFDASGHGKGKEGREDATKNTGYTSSYKGEGKYDESH